jgi:hypothetical protein
MSKIYCNLNKITSIRCKYEYPYQGIIGREDSKPIKKFFGLINTGKKTKEGLYVYDYWYFDDIDNGTREPLSSDFIKKYNETKTDFKIYDASERLSDNFVLRAEIQISLDNGEKLRVLFNTNDEMEKYVGELIKSAGSHIKLL